MRDAALPLFKLYGKENALRTHVNDDPGDHNDGKDNRQAFYRMVGEFPQMAIEIMRELAHRVEDTNKKLREATANNKAA